MIKIISFLCLLIGSITNIKAVDHGDQQLYNAPIGEKSFIRGMVVVSLVNAKAKRANKEDKKIHDDARIDDDVHSSIIFEGSNPLALGIIPDTFTTTTGFRDTLREFIREEIRFDVNEHNVWSLGMSFTPATGIKMMGVIGSNPSRLNFWKTRECLERTTNGVYNKDCDLITYKSVKSWMILEEDAIKTLDFFLIWQKRNSLVYQYFGKEGFQSYLGTEDKLYLNCSLFVSCVLKTLRIMHYSERLASAISRTKGSTLHLCYRQHHRLAVARKVAEKEDLGEFTEHVFYLKAVLSNPAISLMNLDPGYLSSSVNWLNWDEELDLYTYAPSNKREWSERLNRFTEIGGVDTTKIDTTEESPRNGWCVIS